MTTENKKLVNSFLNEIRKQLPDWLKDDKAKLEDILLEISSHIWDSAQEIAGTDDPDSASIQKAINKLGSPKEIARSYKKRGTPKYFISEELWPTYSKVNGFLIAITFTVILIVQLVLVEPNNLPQALINGFTLSFSTIMTFIVVITAIFVGLSHEGYLPDDLGSKDKKKGEEKDPMSDLYKPNEFLFNGLIGILFGLFIIILPVNMINLFRIIVNFIIELFGQSAMTFNSSNLSAEVLTLLTIMGIVTVITGVLKLTKIRTREKRFQINMNILLIFTGIVDFGVSLYVFTNLHLLSEILPISENILLLLALLGIFGAIVEVAGLISKNIKLYGLLEEQEYYPTS
ncbi:MAG: HAAS signaling domain-containing protein [Candidatus Hodarchaeales archaeon]|jgi:hypothetical protein